MARGKKNAARLAAHLVFVDESGFLLIPSVRRTWAQRGQTPVCRHWFKHDRLSVISGLSVSPARKRLGLYFEMQERNIHNDDVSAFLREVLKHLRGHVIVIWDGAKIHKGPPIEELCRRFPRLHLEPLPSYAPELNPDEYVWAQTKTSLANSRPDDLGELRLYLIETLCELSVSQVNLRACVKQSGLSLLS